MDWLGDLVRDLIAPIYPLRVPIAIASVIAVVGLALLGQRRGWFAVARRHPGRAAVLALAVLAVALPLGWYLGSPLLVTTSLNEPPPTAPTVQTPAVGTTAPTHPSSTAAPRPSATAPTSSASSDRSGQFIGADEFHFGSGTATLVEVEPGRWSLRFDDFSVRNGPDLYVYLSPDPSGSVDAALELGTLRATEGSFNTDIPAGTDVSSVRSVVIWCKAFSVEFAVAELR